MTNKISVAQNINSPLLRNFSRSLRTYARTEKPGDTTKPVIGEELLYVCNKMIWQFFHGISTLYKIPMSI